jgi:choline dehydrogenase
MLEALRLSRSIGTTAPFSDVVEFEMYPGTGVEDEVDVQNAVIASVDGYAHPTSTVPMGGSDDPSAVVDANGGVRGIDGLHVIDASIMPDIPSVATNVTTIMIAEAISRRL